ncbi:transposase family protein [Lentzea pudingi]|uniref:transposase family protein n=1 Tax=Lentzea pudingi TaxID=1789439 RepID=UPI00166D8499|nr:transposase family protein [Lentzea pudingi]
MITELLGVVFPQLLDVRIENVFTAGRSVRIQASTQDQDVACPACGFVARRVHSRYERRLSDLMVGGRETLVHLRVRRLFCGNQDCSRATFVEQVAGLTTKYGRRSIGWVACCAISRWRSAAGPARAWPLTSPPT